MTPEERARAEARARKYPSDEEPGGLMAISSRLLDQMFPHPDTTGMTPEEAEAAWAERDVRINAFLDSRCGPRPDGRPHLRTTRPVPGSSEVPAS